MALQGRARKSPTMSASPNPATALARAEGSRLRDMLAWGVRNKGREKKVDTTKQGYTWLKDLYTFAHANKDYLDDPDVQQVIEEKMDKLERSGFLTGRPGVGDRRSETKVDPETGMRYQGPATPEEYTLNDISQMYQRFMMENPSVYKPYEQTGVDETGAMQRVRTDPISGETTTTRPYEKVGEGTSIVGSPTGGKPSAIFTQPKTATPTDSTDVKGKKLAYKIGDPSDSVYVLPDANGRPPEGYTFTKEPSAKGQLTEKNKLDILDDIEEQIQKKRDADEDVTQQDLDRWNRQLSKAGIAERVTEDEVNIDVDWWFDHSRKSAHVGVPQKKSLADIFKK